MMSDIAILGERNFRQLAFVDLITENFKLKYLHRGTVCVHICVCQYNLEDNQRKRER
jgi:hypothetical protein